jgi:hypothetical protein
VALRVSEDWVLRRYLDMEAYRAWEEWKEIKKAGKTKPTTSQT